MVLNIYVCVGVLGLDATTTHIHRLGWRQRWSLKNTGGICCIFKPMNKDEDFSSISYRLRPLRAVAIGFIPARMRSREDFFRATVLPHSCPSMVRIQGI